MAGTRHCSIAVIAGLGVAIEGRSGAGKTSLALGLVDTAKARGLDAAMVSDDQAIVENLEGRPVARAPESIAGLAEIRGYGIAPVPSMPSCVVTLLVRLVADERVDRMPKPQFALFEGAELPLLELPERHEQQSVRIVLAWIEAELAVRG